MRNDTQRMVVATDAAAPAAGPYSQATRLGDLIFASGQLPVDLATGGFPDGIEAQTEACLANLAAVLEAGGGSLATVMKTTVFLKDMNDFTAMNRVYAAHFPDAPPARSTIEVARLPRDARVEIEALAFAVPGGA